MRIRVKLGAVLIPLAVAGVASMAILSRRAVEDIVLRDVSARAASLAQSFAQRPGLEAAVRADDEKTLLPILQEALKIGAVYAAALDADDRVVAHTDVTQRGAMIHPPADARTRRILQRRGPVLEAAAPIEAPGAVSPDIFATARPALRIGTVIVGMPAGPALETAARIQRQVFLVVSGIMGATISLTVFFLDRTLKPLAPLAEGTRRLASGELGVTVDVRSNDELGQLAQSFNRMSRQLGIVTVSKDFLDDILDNMLDGLIVTNEVGRITLVNPSARRFLGEEDWASHALAEILPEAEAARASGSAVANREGFLIRRGSKLPVLFSAAVLRGPRAGWAVTFKDISDRKAAEESLAAKADELERSNQELEQFAYVASHDLQEPLRKVANFTQLLASRYQGKLDADADQFINFILDGSLRMRDLIQDLLSYSRAGRAERPAQDVDLAALVKRVLADLDTSGARIDVAPLPRVTGDAARLSQLFQNLISNALKFRAQDRPSVVRIGAAEERGHWLLWVEDNGIGIEPQFRERVFVLFQRLHSHKDYPGTGIGLAICRKVVESHGGRIWIESPPGSGTRFVFTLPKQPPIGEET